MLTAPWKREVTIAAILFGFGFLALPFLIFWVGEQFIGEYAPDAGPLTLADRLWSDLLRPQPFAWLLVVSPYAVVQIARLLRRVWRAPAL
jgi:hypothetical protein